MLQEVAKHSGALAQAVVDAGALEGLALCLEEFDPAVKEAAAGALGDVARHAAPLAQAVVDAGALPLLVLCLQEPEVPLRRAACAALGGAAGHSAELAQAVVDAGALPLLAPLLGHEEPRLRRAAAEALRAVAKHGVDLAEAVVEAGVFPRVLGTLRGGGGSGAAAAAATTTGGAAAAAAAAEGAARRAAAELVRAVVCQSLELAKLAVSAGSAPVLVDYLAGGASGGGGGGPRGAATSRLPALEALGFLGAFSETLALAVVLARGLPALKDALLGEPEAHVKAAAVWAVGQLGRHTPEHARAVVDAGLLPVLVLLTLPPPPAAAAAAAAAPSTTTLAATAAAAAASSSGGAAAAAAADLRSKAKRALKAVVARCADPAALAPMLREADSRVQKYALAQLALLLPRDAAARKQFMLGGYLQRVQEIKAAAATGTGAGAGGGGGGSSGGGGGGGAEGCAAAQPPTPPLHPKAADAIARINAAFPEEAVK